MATYTVYDSDTGDEIVLPPTPDLIRESLAAGPEGHVRAIIVTDSDGDRLDLAPTWTSRHDSLRVYVTAEDDEEETQDEPVRTAVPAERARAQCATCGDLDTRTPVYIDDRAESREADDACARCGSHDIAHWLPVES